VVSYRIDTQISIWTLVTRNKLAQQVKDPFDRLLLATAFSENMPIISADENFALYQPQIQLIANR
jgi:PIN domain nuclease of toxin-antitoxin system